jgi:hypothetical protein
MANENPWQDETSATGGRSEFGGQGYPNTNPYANQSQTQGRDPYAQESHQGQYQPPDHPPPHQQPLSSHPPNQQQRYYSGNHDSVASGQHQAYGQTEQNSAFSEPASNYQPQHRQSEQHSAFNEPASNYQPQHGASGLSHRQSEQTGAFTEPASNYQPPHNASIPHQRQSEHIPVFNEPASNYQPQHNTSVPAQYHQYQDEEVPPSLPPRRSATDLALPTGQDRSHQIEVMQSYEASGRKDEHDQNVEMLQREFPKLDGSLIAAIYGDSESLSATREMLGALEG